MKAEPIPQCRYGSDCHRKNTEHWLKFSHPKIELTVLKMDDSKEEDMVSPQKDLCYAEKSQADDAKIDHEQQPFDPVEVPNEPFTAACGAENSRTALFLILVGLPGSGKSTFCSQVQSGGQRWTRICQDIISNGKRGSKEQCLKHAEKALSEGCSVLIDRCNLSKDQRHDFLQLARRAKIEAHALVLDLPVKLCIQRAVQRTGHEGGLQGKTAAAAIQRMAQKKELPSSTEGFSLINYCQTDGDVARALNLYQQFNGTCDLQTWFSEKVDQERKLKGSMWPYLHNNERRSPGNQQDDRDSKVNIEDTKGRESVKSTLLKHELGASVEEISQSKHGTINSSGSMPLNEAARTLAFPSISTADFQFDHEKAANIIIERVSDFLLKHEQYGLRLVLVDLKENSDMLVRTRRKAAECGLDSERFSILAGDITRLCSSCGVRCNFIANATNWRLKAGGGGVNAAIFKAAGKEFEIETKKRAKTLSPGTALVVPLSAASPLHKTEGVTHVIHVLGPNMNPQRPNSLEGDYIQGCKILENAYSSLFESFGSAVQSELFDRGYTTPVRNFLESCHPKITTPDRTQGKPLNAFTLLMAAAKRKHVNASSEKKAKHGRQDLDHKAKGDSKDLVSTDALAGCSEDLRYIRHDTGETGVSRQFYPNDDKVGSMNTVVFVASSCCSKFKGGSIEGGEHQPGINNRDEGKSSKKWEPWAEALRTVALHPEQHKDTVLQVTDDAIVFPDLFPKGRKHLLVVARTDGLDSIAELGSSHLPLLQHIHSLGHTWAKSLLDQDRSLVFRIGYHSEPSMRQLHMHVISQDFDSPCLKNKKHWNSFNTVFFYDSKDVIEELENMGRVKPRGNESTLLKTELRCHRCRSVHPNIPRLKNHISSCQVAFPSSLMQQGYLITTGEDMT